MIGAALLSVSSWRTTDAPIDDVFARLAATTLRRRLARHHRE
jgi:hypothetical protein